MRVVCFANRTLGARIANDLVVRTSLDLVAVVTNDPPHVDLDVGATSAQVPVLCWSDYLASFASLPSDRGVSALFRHRVPAEILAEIPIVNLHPSLLPWGRGSHPATWAIWESTPYGGTAHLMTDKIDAGQILAQRIIPVKSTDTSASLYQRGIDALWDVYRTDVIAWLSGGSVTLRDQPGGGSWHVARDLERLIRRDPATLSAVDRDRLARALNLGTTSPRDNSQERLDEPLRWAYTLGWEGL